MKRKLGRGIASVLVLGAVLLAVVEPAAALTRSQAERAVRREVLFDYPELRTNPLTVRCRSLTARSASCRWRGSALAISAFECGYLGMTIEECTDTYRGRARVRQYRRAIDVRLSRPRVT